MNDERTSNGGRASGIVPTDVEYTYEILEKCVFGLKENYPDIEVGSAGKSVLGKEIYYIKIGDKLNISDKTGGGTGEKLFINAAHHAIEWLTTPLVLKFCENILRSGDIYDILKRKTLYVVPMVNPDGVDLANKGFDSDNPYYKFLNFWKRKGIDFKTQWKTNIRGVDLNRNYPARWLRSKRQEEREGYFAPGPIKYGGKYPLSEPESSAMVRFTKKHEFSRVIAYHSQGREIYWMYDGNANEDALKYAMRFKLASGYEIQENPAEAAFAGYKDWFCERFNKPGYTIEVGMGENPLPLSQFDKIYEENEKIMLEFIK